MRLLLFLMGIFALSGAYGQSLSPAPPEPNEAFDLDVFLQERYRVEGQEGLYDHYADLLRHPIAINKASAEELRQSGLFTEAQVASLQLYIQTNGPLLSLYEWQAVPHFSEEDIRKLLPFVKLIPLADGRPFLHRVKEAEKTLSLRYQADPRQLDFGRWLLRFQSKRARDFSMALTAEQDAGEAWRGARPDFLSGHLALYARGKMRMALLGDYQLALGQGLLFAGGFQMGKGSDAVAALRKTSMGLRPYTSTAESGFLRGSAMQWELGRKAILTAFASWQGLDARLDTLSGQFRLLSQTGYHAPSDNSRKALQEWVGGLNIQIQTGLLTWGATVARGQYSAPIASFPESYRQFSFHGKYWQAQSFYGSADIGRLHIFSEIGMVAGKQHSAGGIVGGTLTLLPNLSLAGIYRNYGRSFALPYSRAFGERGQSERGLYAGISWQIKRHWHANAYLDQYRFPWLRYRVDAPSAGYDCLFSIQRRLGKGKTLGLQYKQEEQPVNRQASPMDVPALSHRRSLRLQAVVQAHEHLRLKLYAQQAWHWHGGNYTKGASLMQEVALSNRKMRLTVGGVLFYTGSYDARLYGYEADMLYAFSMPAYSGQGTRWYALGQLRLSKRHSCWVRYARTTQADALSKTWRQELKFQWQVRF